MPGPSRTSRARTRDEPAPDRVLDVDVQARVGRRGAETHGVAAVAEHLGEVRGVEEMLLQGGLGEPVHGERVDPTQIGVGVTQARHERLGPVAVDDQRIVVRLGIEAAYVAKRWSWINSSPV